jgi:hypothetical protein
MHSVRNGAGSLLPGMFAGLTEGANELIASLAPK